MNDTKPEGHPAPIPGASDRPAEPIRATAARWRVGVWLRIERFAERRLRSAYDELVDLEAKILPAIEDQAVEVAA